MSAMSRGEQNPTMADNQWQVMAHRGGKQLRPENTLIAFRNAVELGVDALELDVHATRDGALVVIHDSTVDRTTDGTGAVSNFTLEEITALDAGYNWSPGADSDDNPYRGTGVTIPTLEEVLSAFPNIAPQKALILTIFNMAEELHRIKTEHADIAVDIHEKANILTSLFE